VDEDGDILIHSGRPLPNGAAHCGGRSCALERHVQLAKMHKRAEDNGKQHSVNQGVHETVVEFDKAPRRVEYKYNGRGDQDWR
jgi:hypothetical protein